MLITSDRQMADVRLWSCNLKKGGGLLTRAKPMKAWGLEFGGHSHGDGDHVGILACQGNTGVTSQSAEANEFDCLSLASKLIKFIRTYYSILPMSPTL
jgi:hypothetical protein